MARWEPCPNPDCDQLGRNGQPCDDCQAAARRRR